MTWPWQASLSPSSAWPDGTPRALPCVRFPLSPTPFPSSPPHSQPTPPGPPSSTPLVCMAPASPLWTPEALLSGPSRASVFKDFRHSHLLGWLQGGLKMITGPPTPALPSLEATAVRRLLSSSRTTWYPGQPGTQGFTESCLLLPTLGRSVCSLAGTPCTHPYVL